jgi:hypothetical protein
VAFHVRYAGGEHSDDGENEDIVGGVVVVVVLVAKVHPREAVSLSVRWQRQPGHVGGRDGGRGRESNSGGDGRGRDGSGTHRL